MIKIEISGVDPYLVLAYSKDHTANLANLFETNEEDILFVAYDDLPIYKGVDQTSWNAVVHVILQEKYEPIEKSSFTDDTIIYVGDDWFIIYNKTNSIFNGTIIDNSNLKSFLNFSSLFITSIIFSSIDFRLDIPSLISVSPPNLISINEYFPHFLLYVFPLFLLDKNVLFLLPFDAHCDPN